MTIATGQQALAADILKHATADGYSRYTASSELTIASGAITVTANFYRVDTESDASTDDLDTITAGTGVADGHQLVLRAENTARTVVVKHNTGNILCANGVDQSLDDSHDAVLLVYDSNLTKWFVFGFVGPLSVGTASLAADSVDDTKAGNRVPQFYRRQGGNSSNWSTAGTTDYTPTAVRMQAGKVSVGISTTVTVTFPTAFSQPPLVWVTGSTSGTLVATNVTATTVDLSHNNLGSAIPISWLAIGPE